VTIRNLMRMTISVASALAITVGFTLIEPALPARAVSATLTLVHQDLALTPDTNLSISVRSDQTFPPNSTITVTAYKPVLTRFDLTNIIAGNLPRSVDSLDLDPDAVSTADGVTTFAIPTESSTRTARALQFAQQGLYPVVVDVTTDAAIVAELVTFVDRLPKSTDDARGTLNVGVTASVSSPPAIPGNANALSPTVLQQLADLSAFPATVPLSISVSPELIDRVDAATRDRLRQAFNANLVLSQPRIPFDPSAAVAAGKADRFTALLREGENSIAALGETAPSDRSVWWSTAHLTTSGAALLRDLGTRLIVLSPDEYASASGNLGALTDTTQLLQTTLPDATSVPTMELDPVMADRISNSSSAPELAALYAAADLVVTRDQLAAASTPISGHTMIVGLSAGGVPNPVLLARMQALVSPTGAANFVTLETVERSTTSMLVDGLPVQIVLPLTSVINLSDRLASLDKLNARALTVAGMLVNDAGRAGRWNDTIGVLSSSALSGADVAAASAQLSSELNAITASISPRPAYAFTLSGRRTTIRIRIENTSDEPLKVLVRMTATKLTFPKGDQVVTIEPKTITDVAVPVVARTNGSFPVTLDVLSPDGGTPIANTLFLKARVSALTGLAQLLTGGGLLILLAWWARHLRKTRRGRRTAETMHHHPATNVRDELSGHGESSANVADS
jgi:hypothetical protein